MIAVYTAISVAMRQCGATSYRCATDQRLIAERVARLTGRTVGLVDGCIDDMVARGQVVRVESGKIYLNGGW